MPRIALAVSLFALSLSAQGWVDRTPAFGSPFPRRSPAMCWDGAHNYVLMQGGETANDTWSWNGTAWTQHNPSLVPPAGGYPGYQTGAMVFHPPTNEVVLFSLNGTFTWTGSNWVPHASAVLPSSPYGLPCFVALGRDTARGETVLFVSAHFSGVGSQVFAAAETYVWDGFAWSPRPTATRPGPTGHVSMAFDPVASRLVLQTTGNGFSTFWEWTGTNWQQRIYSGAPAAGGAMACDTADN